MRGPEQCGIWAHGATRGVVDTRRVGCAGFARVRGRTWYMGTRGRTWYMGVRGWAYLVHHEHHECTWYRHGCTWYIMSARVYLVPTWVHEFASVPGTLECAVECAGVPVCTSVPGTWYTSVPGTWYLVHGTWDMGHGSRVYLVQADMVYQVHSQVHSHTRTIAHTTAFVCMRLYFDGVPGLIASQEVISLHGPQSPMRI